MVVSHAKRLKAWGSEDLRLKQPLAAALFENEVTMAGWPAMTLTTNR